MNSALLGKWLWRFGVERAAWWRELIVVKFGLDRGLEWRSNGALNSSGWPIWGWIVKESPEFWKLAYVDPGGGEWVKFWHDVWVSGRNLRTDFPRIAAASHSTDACISDFCVLGSRAQWNIQLTTTLKGGALEEFRRLFSTTRMQEVSPFWRFSTQT
ncbi:hypothetical protein LINGRAHAP2_LOCUS16237 [Linum grandiflorum]